MKNEKKHRGTRSFDYFSAISSVLLRGKILLLTLLIALFSLLISCDLFNGVKQPDFFEKIDKEIRWSNAKKLDVSIKYPPAWGSHNLLAGEFASSPTDIRQGWPFELEFTPDLAYAFRGWRVYETEVLNELNTGGNDWQTDITLLEGVDMLSSSDVEVPELRLRGGKGSFTINKTTTPSLTLVPWCKKEPYVIRTEPRDYGESSDRNGVYFTTPIVIYFNSALNANQNLTLGTDRIDIKARLGTSGDFTTYNSRFESPVYDAVAGQYFITIVPKTGASGPEDGYQIRVTVGPVTEDEPGKLTGNTIVNAQGAPMSKAEVFYYRVTSETGGNASLSGWSASYNEGSRTITVSYNLDGDNGSSAPLKAYYRMNQGADQPITLNTSGWTRSGTIPGVTSLDASGVRDGRGVSDIREYHIFMELDTGGDPIYENFKIWNFPGMSVNNDNPVIEISTPAELAAIPTTGLGRQYVLANDISVSSHSPIGTDGGRFSGKFYGNGHTVTINGVSSADNMGLFGVADNAIIRDLTVQYSGGASDNGEFRFGGIAGRTDGKTQLINVLVKGSVTIGGSGYTAYTGGLVGLMAGDSSISNAYSSLNLTVNTNPNGNSLYVGGIAGSMGTPDGGNRVTVDNATVVGDITVGSITAPVKTFDTGFNIYNIPINNTQGGFVGGLTGFVRGGNWSSVVLQNSEYRQGTISVTVGDGSTWLGGAVGDAYGWANINGCHASGVFDITKTGMGVIFSVGGFVGYADANVEVERCYSNNTVAVNSNATGAISAAETYIGGFVGRKNAKIEYCYAQGDVSITSYSGVFVGGFLGYTRDDESSTNSYCYATGNVSVVSFGDGRSLNNLPQDTIVGGFMGFAYRVGETSNCYALGDVFVSKPAGSGTVHAGGFAGCLYGCPASRCFAKGKVIAQRNANGTINAGGFVGFHQNFSNRGALNQIAALGESVTATGGGNPGRIYESSNSASNVTNNRAYNGMRLYQSATYGDSKPGESTPTPAANGQHGANATIGEIRSRSFWETTLGFSSAAWDFTYVGLKGYPRLRRSANGPAMEGQ